MPLYVGVTDGCNYIATKSLVTLLSTITDIIEPLTLGTQAIDINFLTPFIIFLVYKAAAIVTERLLIDSDSTEGLKRLRTLRKFLKIVGERWLGCGELSKDDREAQIKFD